MNKKKEKRKFINLYPDDVNPFANIKVKKKPTQKKGKAKAKK